MKPTRDGVVAQRYTNIGRNIARAVTWVGVALAAGALVTELVG
jgi:hypothetical protein